MTRRLASSSLRYVLAGITMLVIGFIWQVSSAASESIYFPSLLDILEVTADDWLFEGARLHFVPSMVRLLTGYLAATVAGIAAGLLLGLVPALRKAFGPLIDFGRSLPAVSLLPVVFVLFGFGDTGKIVLIAMVCFFPVVLNAIDGVRAVPDEMRDVIRTYRISRRDAVWRVILPSAAPYIFTGMRISLAIAFIMVIITEMFAAGSGIGYYTLHAQRTFDLPGMWSGMIVMGLVGLTLNGIFLGVERYVLRWHYAARRSS